MTKLLLKSLAAAFALASTQCWAAIIFDTNANPDVLDGAPIGGQFALVTDFQLGADTYLPLSGISFWTLESSTAYWDGLLVYAIWPDDQGQPIDTLPDGGSAGTSTTRTFLETIDTSNAVFSRYRYDVTLPALLSLDVDRRYWLGLYTGSNSQGMLWQYTSSQFGNLPLASLDNSAPPAWSTQFSSDLAFQLVGEEPTPPSGAPVPATALLLLLGLPALARFRRAN